MVFEATYLVAVLTAGHMSLCCGQNSAQMSKVLRPSNKSNGMFICFLMAVETTGSECGLVHPPYAKPLLVSSSGPPGACMTPSRETNSSTLTFLMTDLLRVLSDFCLIYGCPRFSMSQVMPLGSRDADPARGTPTPAVRPESTKVLSLPLSCFRWVLRQLNGRTSTGARQATAASRPHASASSRLAASSTQKPPMCSFVSRYGPSVTSTLPSGCARSDFALLAAERPPTKTTTPAAAISLLSTSISRAVASVSADGSKSSGW